MGMKVTFISDTHTRHWDMNPIPGGDILIFSGDSMGSGYRPNELKAFIEWFKDQAYRYKIYVPGNHDRYCEKYPSEVKEWFNEYYDQGVRFLCNDMVEINGLKIYGTPYQPYFCDWAFNVPDTEKLYNIYKQIPENLDILVTHCPPYDILDKTHLPRPYYGETGEEPLGSQELTKVLNELGDKVPRYHSFGHIHGDGGKVITIGKTTYINASICDEGYYTTNDSITLDIEPILKGDE